jgi:thymidylate kinase
MGTGQMIVIFEGADKTGKDSLIKEFHKLTNYKYSCINRFSGTSYAYGKFWKRNLDYKKYLLQDIEYFDKAVLVYLYAPKEILEKRFKEHNEKDIDLKKLEILENYYNEYLTSTPLYTILVNTNKSISSCAKQIRSGLREYEKETIKHKINRLVNTINIAGDKVYNTSEVKNINVIVNNLNKKHLKRFHFDYTEKYEYNQIYHVLRNNIRLKLDYLKSQDVFSRQFTYTSESCISFVQLLLRNNCLNVYATIRSSNVSKMLEQDIMGIYKISKALDEEYFKTDNIKLNINIVSAHLYANGVKNGRKIFKFL